MKVNNDHNIPWYLTQLSCSYEGNFNTLFRQVKITSIYPEKVELQEKRNISEKMLTEISNKYMV